MSDKLDILKERSLTERESILQGLTKEGRNSDRAFLAGELSMLIKLLNTIKEIE